MAPVGTTPGQQTLQIPPPSNVREMSRIEQKFQEIDYLDDMLAKVAIKRFDAVCKELKIEDITKLDPKDSLVFVESWARTLAQTLK